MADEIKKDEIHRTCSTHGRKENVLVGRALARLNRRWGANVNPLNPELNPICYLLALLAHHFLHVSRIMVKSLILTLLMSYTYMERIFLMFLDHTTTQHSR